MTNPSTLARQKWYGVNSTPSYFIDGDSDGGGGSASNAKSIFDKKVDPVIQKHLQAAPEAKIDLKASAVGSTIKVKTSISNVTNKSDKLRLHIVLAEDMVRYSGENGLRFHEMVVRSVAVPQQAADAKKPAADAKASDAAKPDVVQGFPVVAAKGGTFEYTFDLAKVVADAKAHLDEFEKNPPGRFPKDYKFHPQKHEITGPLSVVAFVQDETTKKILQAVYVKAAATKTTN